MQHDDDKTMMKMMYRGISISRYFKTHYSSVSGHDTAPLPDYDTGGLAVCTCVAWSKATHWSPRDAKQTRSNYRRSFAYTSLEQFHFRSIMTVFASRALTLAVLTAAQWTNLTISRARWTVICRRTCVTSIDLLTKDTTAKTKRHYCGASLQHCWETRLVPTCAQTQSSRTLTMIMS